MNLRVTSRTESDHQMQNRLARFAMMHSGMMPVPRFSNLPKEPFSENACVAGKQSPHSE